jgi:hypothetical protein
MISPLNPMHKHCLNHMSARIVIYLLIILPIGSLEERTDDPVDVINYIVELQPNNDEGFNNVVSIELDKISWPTEKTIEGIKDFEEDYITTGGIGSIVSSERSSVAGYPAQKIVYTEQGDDFTFKKMETDVVAFDREYKIIYDTSSPEFFDKYLTTVEEMLKTIKITQPIFEGIVC